MTLSKYVLSYLDPRVVSAVATVEKRFPDLYGPLVMRRCRKARLFRVANSSVTTCRSNICGEVWLGRPFLDTLDQEGIDYLIAFTAQHIECDGLNNSRLSAGGTGRDWELACSVHVHHKLAMRGYDCPIEAAIVNHDLGRLTLCEAFAAYRETHPTPPGAGDGAWGVPVGHSTQMSI